VNRTNCLHVKAMLTPSTVALKAYSMTRASPFLSHTLNKNGHSTLLISFGFLLRNSPLVLSENGGLIRASLKLLLQGCHGGTVAICHFSALGFRSGDAAR